MILLFTIFAVINPTLKPHPMKPIKSLLLFAGFLFCVACDQDVLTDLQSQINALKSNQIAAIEAQVGNINASITALEATDTELKGYIATLQEQQTALAQENGNLAELIAATKKDLQDSIGTVQADLLAQLEAYKQTVSGQLALINASIATLTEKDTALEAQIAALRKYTDGEIQKTKDWASATFVTLEKYNETVALVTTIQQQIAAINTRMDTFQNDLTTLSTQLAGLREDHLKAIQDNAAALATVVTNITNAYTEAIAMAITTSETSLKNWVAAELTAYYTAAQTDAKLEALQAEQDQKLNQQKAYVENLLTNLQTVLEGKISANTELINGLQGQINNLSAEAAQLAKSILDNADFIAVNSTKIKENAQAISQNSADITTCGSLIADNKTLIQDNARAIAANDTAILALQASVATNEQGISNNVINIAKNAADIAVNAGLIAANATAISNNTTAISDNAAAITQLQTDLQMAIADLTDSYNSAIQTAITTLDGKLTGEIASQISTVNTRIDTEVATINSAITALTARVEACESDIVAIRSDIAAIRAEIEALQSTVASLLARIQSISYVPKYSDSKAVMTFTNNGSLTPGFSELTFKIQPASAANTLVEVWQTAMTVESVMAETRTAPETVNLPIQSVSADRGYLTVFVGGTGLSEDFFTGAKPSFVALVVSDGNNNHASEYVNLIPEVAITTEDATDITPVSASIRGSLGKETAARITENPVLYYSATETELAGLVANGQHQDLTPAANGAFGTSLQQLETDAMYHFVAAVKDCGEWFYSPVKTFSTLNYTAEAVDMGLPSGLKWSAYNLGASSPEGFGAFFAWGETEPKTTYMWETYRWCNGSETTFIKYCISEEHGIVDNKTMLEKADDVVIQKLGGTWRMPTAADWTELQNSDYCTWIWNAENGVNGYRVTSKVTGQSLFLPAAGQYRNSDPHYNMGTNGYYWSSDLYSASRSARRAGLSSSSIAIGTNYRCYGLSVRPVMDFDWDQIQINLTTVLATDIQPNSAQLNGNLIVNSEYQLPKKVWFLMGENLTTLDTLIRAGEIIDAVLQNDGSFYFKIPQADKPSSIVLNSATSYYYVACAQIGTRTFYGEVGSFRTPDYSYTAQAIDMGLPSGLKWASYNLGAASPEMAGAYFAWGETNTKDYYSWDSYSLSYTYKDGNMNRRALYKYNTSVDYGVVDDLTVLDVEDDAVSSKLGLPWRMPTEEDWEELRNYCDIIKETQAGVNGYRVTSQITGNSIFLPVTGCRSEGILVEPTQCHYWSSSLNTYDCSTGLAIYGFNNNSLGVMTYYRGAGLNIRPVRDWDWSQIEVTITSNATPIEQHRAQLNGQLSVSGALFPNKTVWFLFGEGLSSIEALKSSGKRLDTQIQQDGSFSSSTYEGQAIVLNAATTYYYVACAKIGTRIFYSDVRSFTTASYTYSAEAVDMGLSVQWSSMNLGAASPEQDGAYYAWGETEPKASYAWSTYLLYDNTTSRLVKYNTNSSSGLVDNKETLDPEDDAASVKLGNGWRVPTIAEWQELRTNSTRMATTQNGTTGWLITSTITGNSIFLPASGYRQNNSLDRKNYQGRYWSSNIRDTSPECAWTEELTSDAMWENMDGRQYGFSIRPVKEP